MLSKNPKIAFERMLVFGALGLYVMKYIKLKKNGQLAGEPDWLLKVDKKKLFDMAQKRFGLNDSHREIFEQVYNSVLAEKDV